MIKVDEPFNTTTKTTRELKHPSDSKESTMSERVCAVFD